MFGGQISLLASYSLFCDRPISRGQTTLSQFGENSRTQMTLHTHIILVKSPSLFVLLQSSWRGHLFVQRRPLRHTSYIIYDAYNVCVCDLEAEERYLRMSRFLSACCPCLTSVFKGSNSSSSSSSSKDSHIAMSNSSNSLTRSNPILDGPKPERFEDAYA